VVWLVADCGLPTYRTDTNLKRVVTLQISTNTAINYTTCYRLPFINQIFKLKTKKMNVKYRGLSYDKKTWYYGLPTILIEENYDNGIIDGIRVSWEENQDVIPKTIGLFTGKIDVNGNEVYEGDWIKCGYMAVIEWDEKECCFVSRYSHPEDPENLLLCDLGDIEVVGNIHQPSSFYNEEDF
jgi:hypothetical protein